LRGALSGGTLLRHVSEFVRHESDVGARFAAAEKDIVAVGKRTRADRRAGFLREGILMDAHLGEVGTEMCPDARGDSGVQQRAPYRRSSCPRAYRGLAHSWREHAPSGV
jgi:hypothetical protein